MNAGIVLLQDGTPCIAYDEKLPYPIKEVEFSREDFLITLVYDVPPGTPPQGRKFEFPLDHPFVKVLEERGLVAVALMNAKDLTEIKVYSVFFTNK